MAIELTPAEYSLAYEAKAIIGEFCTPGLDPECSLGTIRQTVLSKLRYARLCLDLELARAGNHDQAQPDGPAADKWCGWCGSTNPPGGLEWDSDDEDIRLTGVPDAALPSWFCAWVKDCVRRRRQRYPDRRTPELRQAREFLALAQEQAQPAILALTALTVATRQQEAALAQESTVELSSPQAPPQGRPAAPLYGPAAQAWKWRHCISNPGNRAHLISRSR